MLERAEWLQHLCTAEHVCVHRHPLIMHACAGSSMASSYWAGGHAKVIIKYYRNLHMVCRRDYYFDSLLEAIAFLQYPQEVYPLGADEARHFLCLGPLYTYTPPQDGIPVLLPALAQPEWLYR